MLPLVLIGIGVAIGVLVLARVFVAADPRLLAKGVRYAGIGLGAAVALFLVIRGGLGPFLALSAVVVPVLARLRARRAAMRTQPASGQTSRVETLYLRVELDHDSGDMTGMVLHGPHKGRVLDGLDPEEALDLLAECRREDPQSATVLEAWLDRTHPDWRGHAAGSADSGAAARPSSGAMTREEAYEILGLAPGASPEQVKDAHRRLMMALHPDHGGSTYLAAKINQAKDLLLRH